MKNILRINRKSNFKYNRKIFTRLMLFIFSLIITTFAWITYTKILNDEINIHILSWDLQYLTDTNGDGVLEELENPLQLNVSELYPSMEEQVIDVIIKNNGEASIDLSYDIASIVMLEQEYEIVESEEEAETEYYIIPAEPVIEELVENIENEETLGEENTEETIENSENQRIISAQDILNNAEEFPFNIQIIMDTQLEKESEAHLIIKITWAGTNDELDSVWGHKVAKYIQESENPQSAMQVVLQVNAIQARTS